MEIELNHGHVLTIPVADLSSAVDMTYSIMGTALHDHTVTFTPAQLAMLQGGMTVTVTSSLTVHMHVVHAVCVGV